MITAILISAALLRAGPSDTSLVEETSYGTFQRATRLVATPQGWTYTLDADRDLVLLSNKDGQTVATVGGYGWSPTTFDQPTGLATDGLNVYVSDRGNNRLLRFDRSLNFISSFSTRDTSFLSARFGMPLGVALSRLGDVFVLDGENLRVIKFTPAMQYERSFGDLADARAKLRQPLQIQVSANDRVVVLEPDKLLEFDYFGQYLREIGRGRIRDARGFCFVRDDIIVVMAETLLWFNHRGELLREIRRTEIAGDSISDSMEDVTALGDRLMLLTSTRIHVLRIITSSN